MKWIFIPLQYIHIQIQNIVIGKKETQKEILAKAGSFIPWHWIFCFHIKQGIQAATKSVMLSNINCRFVWNPTVQICTKYTWDVTQSGWILILIWYLPFIQPWHWHKHGSIEHIYANSFPKFAVFSLLFLPFYFMFLFPTSHKFSDFIFLLYFQFFCSSHLLVA